MWNKDEQKIPVLVCIYIFEHYTKCGTMINYSNDSSIGFLLNNKIAIRMWNFLAQVWALRNWAEFRVDPNHEAFLHFGIRLLQLF